MDYENKIYDVWCDAMRGLPTEYHKRLADRVVACLGNWLDGLKECNIYSVEDAISDIKYHRRQIDAIIEEDRNRDRYALSYLEKIRRHERHRKDHRENP